MTITPGQMRAAGQELRMRRDGAVTQQPDRKHATRPFGAATIETLRRIASGPTPNEVSEMKRELHARDSGQVTRGALGTERRPFAAAQTKTLRHHVK